MSLIQLIYASRPLGYDEFSLVGILASARQANQQNGVTGCLICREDLYLQMLEGKPAAIKALYERIVRDTRHTEVTLLWSGEVATRQFPDWAMRDDPARSWMWSAAAVAAGAATKASAAEVREIFARVTRETA